MRVGRLESIKGVLQDLEPKFAWIRSFLDGVARFGSEVERAINGGLTFGDGTAKDNIAGKWITYTTHATPDAESTIAHSLGVIPPGFILMKPPAAGYIYRGATAWTATNIYLKCTAADEPVTIFVLSKPQIL